MAECSSRSESKEKILFAFSGDEYRSLLNINISPGKSDVAGGSIALSVRLCEQQLPNINVSTQTPTCFPSDRIHS